MKRTAETGVPPMEQTARVRGGDQRRQICPQCSKARVRRSRRRTVTDHLLRLFGLRPYRCHECDYRYHARGQTRAQRSRWARWAHRSPYGTANVAFCKCDYLWRGDGLIAAQAVTPKFGLLKWAIRVNVFSKRDTRGIRENHEIVSARLSLQSYSTRNQVHKSPPIFLDNGADLRLI